MCEPIQDKVLGDIIDGVTPVQTEIEPVSQSWSDFELTMSSLFSCLDRQAQEGVRLHLERDPDDDCRSLKADDRELGRHRTEVLRAENLGLGRGN